MRSLSESGFAKSLEELARSLKRPISESQKDFGTKWHKMARFLGDPPFFQRPADEFAEVCSQVLTGLVMVLEGTKFLQSMAEEWSVGEAAAVAGMQATWGI